MPWEAMLAFVLVVGFALLARRLLAKGDEYDSDGRPTVLDLWSRGGGGDAGPGG
jgi:hypothetical protein